VTFSCGIPTLLGTLRTSALALLTLLESGSYSRSRRSRRNLALIFHVRVRINQLLSFGKVVRKTLDSERPANGHSVMSIKDLSASRPTQRSPRCYSRVTKTMACPRVIVHHNINARPCQLQTRVVNAACFDAKMN
jgi:hypothetical protein